MRDSKRLGTPAQHLRAVCAALQTILVLLGCLTAQATFAQAPFATSATEATVASDASASSAQTASPSPEQLQRARGLFSRGVQLASEGAYTRAAQKFQEALAIYPAPAVEYNLASALFELRRFDEAYNAVSHVLTTPEVPAEVRQRSEKLEQTLRAKVARLTVVIGGSSEGAVVMVDGIELRPEQIGLTRAVPPGGHRVEAVRAGNLVSARNIDIPVRTAALVDVSMIPSADREIIREVFVSAEAEHRSSPMAEMEGGMHWARDWRVWGSVAAVLVAGGVTATVLLLNQDGSSEPKPVQGNLEPGVITW